MKEINKMNSKKIAGSAILILGVAIILFPVTIHLISKWSTFLRS